MPSPSRSTTPVVGSTLNVRVGEGELGRVIGRRGRTAASIRTVARAAASKDDVEIDIEFLDD